MLASAEQLRDARQEHRRGLAPAPGAHEPADGLREEQRRRGARRVDADREPRDVDALGDHADGDHPARGARGELVDPVARAVVVGEHDGRRLARDPREVAGVGARVGLVGRDDHGARVRDGAPDLGQPAVRRGEHARDPLAVRVERRAPRLRGHVLGERLPQPRADLVAGLGAPAHRAAVGQEDHRPHDVVAQRVAVAVGVVGDAAPDAVAGRGRSARTGSPRCRSGTACRSARAGGSRPRTPRAPRRPSSARRRRGAPRRGSPAWAPRPCAPRAARACWPPGRRSRRRRRTRARAGPGRC